MCVKVTTLGAEGDRLIDIHPNQAEDIRQKQAEIAQNWEKLRRKVTTFIFYVYCYDDTNHCENVCVASLDVTSLCLMILSMACFHSGSRASYQVGRLVLSSSFLVRLP